MFAKRPDDDLVQCPYEKSHLILRQRFQLHLLRCGKNHPDVELQKCPFNGTHLLPESEYVSHVTTCPDRKLITQYKYNLEVCPNQGKMEDIKHFPLQASLEEENWDDTETTIEPNVRTFSRNHVRQQPRKNSTSRSRSRSPVLRPYQY